MVITERSRPSFVLLTCTEYQRLLGIPSNLAKCLEMDEEIEFEIDPVGVDIRSADV